MTQAALAKKKGHKQPRRNQPKRGRVYNLRVGERDNSLIERARSATGQTRTDFMLAGARERAQTVLLNQTYFELDEAEWDAFWKTLEAPPPPNAALRALMASAPPWSE